MKGAYAPFFINKIAVNHLKQSTSLSSAFREEAISFIARGNWFAIAHNEVLHHKNHTNLRSIHADS